MKKNILQALSDCANEEEVKVAFIQFFRSKLPRTFKFDSRKNIDFYTPQILFEFKFDGGLNEVSRRARAFAQSLYYIRRLKYGSDVRVPSRLIAVVDKKSAAIIPADDLSTYYEKSARSDQFDWDLAPSTPCKKLIAALIDESVIQQCRVYNFADHQDADEFVSLVKIIYLRDTNIIAVKKNINEDNFYEVFEHWNQIFGESVKNKHKNAEYFLTDIEEGKSNRFKLRRVKFELSDGSKEEKVMPIDSYEYFWSVHERVTDARTMIAIRQKMDRMTALDLRRFTGEFYTPVSHARKALEYIGRVVGAQWWTTGEYRLWDMAAGTGNLEFALPNDALQYCYISTLLNDDAAYCKKIYPSATVFQYDYLNDGEEKLPSNLRADLSNPAVKWIVFINPPYATASNNERDPNRVYKFNVSMTAIRKLMTEEGMGEVSRELFNQFFYRINRELGTRQTIIGVFSKIKYINATIDQRLRDKVFDYKFEGGFIFSSRAFHGTKGLFPVGFAMWNLTRHIPLTNQTIAFDVFNDQLDKIGEKKILSLPRGALLNKWIVRPPTTKKFPPFSNALSRTAGVKDVRDRIADGFLASLMCNCNDLMHQNKTALFSGPLISAGALSVTADNFEKAMVVHAVRRLPKATWLNDKDQFLRPTKKLPTEFVNDCVVWSLFAPSNNTTALKDVEYEGEIYQIKNNLYPWTIEEIRDWGIEGDEDRFAAKWLKAASLSTEARAVLEAAKKIYRLFYSLLEELDRRKFKIETWDAGRYQVFGALKDANLLDDQTFRAEFDRLGKKILPQIYSFGFLRDEVTYFD